MSKAGLIDAQANPGNGPGDGQSAAGSPPQGDQTSVRELTGQNGPGLSLEGETTSKVLDYRG